MSAGMPAPESANGSNLSEKQAAMPLEVMILTRDHEIRGIVYVSRNAKEDRRISELLNEPDKRFLAVTDAHLVPRLGPSTPRLYSFLQLHIDNIVMIHPSTQAVMRNVEYSREEAVRFDHLRSKLVSSQQI